MRVHAHTCEECGFYHDRMPGTRRDGKVTVKCVDCGWREVIELGELA